jgi:hypothetical protein
MSVYQNYEKGAKEDTNGELPRSMTVMIDNYKCVNDGDAMTTSDHAPVYATFVLRVRHDYEQLLRDSVNKKSVGSIQTLFTALQGVDARSPQAGVIDIDTSPIVASSGDVSAARRYASPSRRSVPSRPPLASTESHQRSNATELDTVETTNDTPNQAVKLYKYSLLPPGIYKFRVSNIKLLWGTDDLLPSSVAVLFPAPFEVSWLFGWFLFILSNIRYLCITFSVEFVFFLFLIETQAIAGEQFVDFVSEIVEEHPSHIANGDFSLSSLAAAMPETSSSGSPVKFRGNAAVMTTPPSSAQKSGPAVSATTTTTTTTTTPTTASGLGPSPRRGGASAVAALEEIERSIASLASKTAQRKWVRGGPSKTGTCGMASMVGGMQEQSTSSGGNSKSASAQRSGDSSGGKMPNLLVTWRGDEPLDKLHLSFKVSIMCWYNSGVYQ